MTAFRTPVAIFTYNRPGHTRSLLQSLAACERLEECRVLIFSDGPRVPGHVRQVEEVRALIRAWGRERGAEIIERPENLGLARSIVGGVTQLCNEYGRVIVVEDDLILHPAFLDFMLQALDRYQEEDRVAQVAGFTFPIQTPEEPDAFFLPLTSSWGWATWKRAWETFSWDVQDALDRLGGDSRLRLEFDFGGNFPGYEMLSSAVAGRTDSWAIRWYWSVFRQGKIVLFPRRSLVWQNGFDNLGTNTKGPMPFMQGSLDSVLRSEWRPEIKFPRNVEVDQAVFETVLLFLQKNYATSTTRGRMALVYNWLKRKVKLICRA